MAAAAHRTARIDQIPLQRDNPDAELVLLSARQRRLNRLGQQCPADEKFDHRPVDSCAVDEVAQAAKHPGLLRRLQILRARRARPDGG